MAEKFYDIEGQKVRGAQIRQLVINNHISDITDDGKPIGVKWLKGGAKPDEGGISEWFYFCQALWNEDDCYGKLTEKISAHFSPLEGFRTFEPFFCVRELVRNKKALSQGLIQRFEKYALEYLDGYMHPQEDFIGVNDNTPCLMVGGLILGGEYFKNTAWLEEGKKRLVRLKQMLLRRGFLSEYNSLTYIPLAIYGLATVVNYSENEECRQLALDCEKRIWEGVAALYQPSVGQTAGPYARAYFVDKLAQSYNMRTLLYILLGDKCGVNPINTVFAENTDENYYWQICAAHIGSMVYHCPVDIAESMINKKFPQIVQGTAENSASADTFLLKPIGHPYSEANQKRNILEELKNEDELFEYGAGVINLYTYLDDSYSMGVATRDWHCGADTDIFTILYADSPNAISQNQVGTIFANYTINESDILGADLGRKAAFQDERTAMVLYRPRWQGESVTDAGLNIVFGNASLINEIVIDGKSIFTKDSEDFEVHYTTKKLESFFVHTADIYMMFIPLIPEKDRKDAFLEVKSCGENLRVTIYNYKGEVLKYHRKGFCTLMNGFICELRRRDEFDSFDDFIKIMSDFEISEEVRTNIHTRYAIEREINYCGHDKSLACCVSPLTDGIKYMTVNGNLIEEPKFLVREIGNREN